MLNFPKEALSSIKKYLLRQRKEVDKSLKEVEADDPAISPALAEPSEPGTDSYIADGHAKTIVLQQQLKKLKSNITSSLLKIRRGDYGKCENCKSQIELGRLMVMPTASRCVSCSKNNSKKR